MLTKSTSEASPSFTDLETGASAAGYAAHEIFRHSCKIFSDGNGAFRTCYPAVRGCVYSQVLPSPFNHSKLHMAVYGLSLHQGSTESRKTPEQKFIFQIGTLNPLGINERFSTNLFCCFSRYHAPTNSVAASFCM